LEPAEPPAEISFSIFPVFDGRSMSPKCPNAPLNYRCFQGIVTGKISINANNGSYGHPFTPELNTGENCFGETKKANSPLLFI
jgi:hypothetical protein